MENKYVWRVEWKNIWGGTLYNGFENEYTAQLFSAQLELDGIKNTIIYVG